MNGLICLVNVGIDIPYMDPMGYILFLLLNVF